MQRATVAASVTTVTYSEFPAQQCKYTILISYATYDLL